MNWLTKQSVALLMVKLERSVVHCLLGKKLIWSVMW